MPRSTPRRTLSLPARSGPGWDGGSTSNTWPPATVSCRPASRRTKLSPTSRTTGRDRERRANASPPGDSSLVSYSLTRASRSAEPAYSLYAPREVSGWSRPRTGRITPSNIEVALHRPGSASTSPRSRSALVVPDRFTATRLTGWATPRDRLCVWSPRIRARWPDGSTSASCPTASGPPVKVPVTTVPAPLIVNTRSTNWRARPDRSGGGAWARTSSSAPRSRSIPCPVIAEHGTTGAVRSRVPARRAEISSVLARRVASSTRSHLVRATTPPSTPRTSTIWRCSSDWGFHPSSAATTNKTRRTGPTPASMFRTNRSCPGTSTNPISRPDGSTPQANPRSMVRPLRFSSARRSGSIPVSRRINADLPWST